VSARQVDLITDFVGAMAARELPPAVLDAAKQCLVDWFAVSLAALPDAGPAAVRRQALQWRTQGRALNLYGDPGAAAPMALVNATLSHSLDYDDFHFANTLHASGPTWAAALAAGQASGASGADMLRAFIAGYEVGATMCADGIGPRLVVAGWNPTGVLGHFSAAVAAALLCQLDAAQTASALGLAATQAAGLQASGGSMAKPFHVGKAAMNGVMAAELAALGMDANTTLLDDAGGGVAAVLFQQPTLARFEPLGRSWQIEGNTFKPYASCQLTHAAYEAARQLADGLRRQDLREIRVRVNPLAVKVANRTTASTPMEAKFNIPYCVGLGLMGYGADLGGFSPERLGDAGVHALAAITRVSTGDDVARCAAHIEIEHSGGAVLRAQVAAALGSPERPLGWDDLQAKFLSLATPVLGGDAARLLEALRGFEQPGRAAEVAAIMRRASTPEPA